MLARGGTGEQPLLASGALAGGRGAPLGPGEAKRDRNRAATGRGAFLL